jgi:LysR family transcriptional regulator of beta-lactamase
LSRAAVSLNALRAFEAAARHRSFTRAADELNVTQAAVSHLVKGLEARLGAKLFRRSPRGLVLTDEGVALAPTLADSFERIDRLIDRFEGGRVREVLTVSVVGAFALGWLMPRLGDFRAAHPFVDLRLLTNNNKVDLAGEGLDYAIRFGDGAWHGAEAEHLFDAPLAPLCDPVTAAVLHEPNDLGGHTLLRSFRPQDWPAWFAAAGIEPLPLRGPLFDNSWIMTEAAMLGEGVALAPPMLFERALAEGRLVQPFAATVVTGAYWLTRLTWKPPTAAMQAFRDWLAASTSAPVAER